MVERAGVPSSQTMGTLRMQVGPGLCGLEQLLKPQGERQALLMSREREEAQFLCWLRGEGHNKPRRVCVGVTPPPRLQSKGMFEQ